MIRSSLIRLSTGLTLLAQVIALMGLCPCASARVETSSSAPATMSSCHEGMGLRISSPEACCCRKDGDASGRNQAMSLSPDATSFFAAHHPSTPLRVSVPSLLPRHTAALSRRGFVPLGSPLRV